MTTDRSDDEQAPTPSLPTPRRRERVQTRTGRAISAQNATRHGVLSTEIIGSQEEETEFRTLLEALVNEFEPVATTEYTLVQRLATLFWRERRLVKAEAQKLRSYENEITPGQGRTPFPIEYQLQVGRYQTMLSNQVSKTIDQIRRVKEERES